MGVDWEYLRGVTREAGEWGEAELEELYQTLAGVSKLRPRDKTADKLELLFTLTQAVMIAKYSQVISLEEELGHLAESAGKGDAQREQELEGEIARLKALVASRQSQDLMEDENIAYDWSSGWRIKKKEMEEALRKKNNEIQQFMDDLEACEEERTTLRSTVDEIQERLLDATREINNITADYMNVKQSLTHAQESLLAAREEINGMKSHTEELAADKICIQQKYDELSSAVDAKVNQLKVVVSQREEELRRVKSQLSQRTSTAPPTFQFSQNDLSQVIQLEQELKEKDLEIARLQEKLTEASKEIESSAVLIAKLKKSKMSAVEGETAVISQLRGELHEAQEHMQRMHTQLLVAEEDAQLHAQDLSVVIGELQSYMAGEFSLADAVRELKEARSQVRIRDTQITQLTALVNSFQININDLIDENGQLREQLKLEPREDIELPGVNKTNWQDSKKIIERLTSQVYKLEDEKVTLRTKVYQLTRELSNNRGSLQFYSENTARMYTQPLEKQLNNLSAAVTQLVQERETPFDNDYQHQLDELKEKCFRLEGEKISLEILLADDKTKRQPFGKEVSTEKSLESRGVQSSPSPLTALDELIAALGSLPPSAEEVIAKLKNQVNYLVQECNKREEEISQREKAGLIYTNQFDSLHEQVCELNSQFGSERDNWLSEKEEMIKHRGAMEDEIVALKSQIDELKATVDVIASKREDIDGKLAHRLAELRYDLEVFKRLDRNQGREISALHAHLKEKVHTLQQSHVAQKLLKNESDQEQELLKHRISHLEEELNKCVPRTMADQTAAQLASITAKYRSLLQVQALMMQEKHSDSQKDVQIKQLMEEREELSHLLESAREKVHSLQASLNLVGVNTTHIQVEMLSKQLASIELRELREKQKAEHATIMYQNIKSECDELHHRVKELQNTIDSTSKMNLALQTTEMELRQQLQGAISEEEHCVILEQFKHLKEENTQLSADTRRLQNLTEVAELQLRQRKITEMTSQFEIEQLRKRAEDLAAISNERAKIDELHQEIFLLKVRNLEGVTELEEAKATIEKQNMSIIRMSHQLRDRERLLETSTDMNRARSTRLYALIRDIRQQYAGAVPLSEQERLVDLMETMKQERNLLQAALQGADHDKMEAKVALRQLLVKQEALDELKNALSSSNATKHISSWCSKLEEVKLKNVELNEKLECLEEAKALYEVRLGGKEKRLGELQAQLTNMEKIWMNEQLIWEERETELNRALEKHEIGTQKAILELETLSQQDQPDHVLPLSKQLEQALDTLRNKNVLLGKLERELEDMRNETCAKQQELQEKEFAIIARDRIINDLRVKGSSKNIQTHSVEIQDRKESHGMNSAEQGDESIAVIIAGLKERLKLSQEAVNHYQDLLAKSHAEQESLIAKHRDKVSCITQERDNAQAKTRELQSQLNNIPTRDPGLAALSEAQITQIHNLEDTVKTLDAQLEETRNELLIAKGKVAQLERELTVLNRENSEEKEHMEVSIQVRAQQHQRELDRLSGEMNNLRHERDDLRREVAFLKEASNRAPSAILRTLVEKLRDQLIDKEKQVAKLSYAVQEMKGRVAQLHNNDDDKESISVAKDVGESTNKVVESLKTELEEVHKANDDLEHRLSDQIKSHNTEQEKNREEKETLKDEVNKIQEENESLKDKVKTLKGQNLKIEKQMLQQKKNTSIMKEKLEDLEGRSPAAIIRVMQNLKEKLEKMDATQEVEETEARKAKTLEQVVRWDERKKLRGIIDKLKTRVKELENTLEASKKKLETSCDLLSRVEKEKLSLQFKLNNVSKVSVEKMCSVCLKTLNPLEMGSVPISTEDSSPAHTSRSMNKTFRQVRLSPSPDRSLVTNRTEKDKSKIGGNSPVPSRKSSCDQDESEVRLRTQLKKALEEKQRLETKLKGAVEEVAALRRSLQQKEEEEEKMLTRLRISQSKPLSGAAVVLEYESRILALEEDVRQKSRLLAHVKQVVREAAAREEALTRDKDTLLQKVTLLESISEDTPAARLIHELRQAKLTVTRLQRHIDQAQKKP